MSDTTVPAALAMSPPDVESTQDTRDDSNAKNLSSNLHTSQHSRSSSASSSASRASSVGEIPEEKVKQLKESFDRISKELDDNTKEFPHIEILNDAKKKIKKIQQQLKDVQEFRKAQKDSNAMIIPFSSLTWPKLKERLGVRRLNSTVDANKFTSIIKELKAQHDLESQAVGGSKPSSLYPPKNWQHTTVSDNLQHIQKLVLLQNEASARIAINEWVLQLGKYIDSETKSWIVIVPEPIIQTSSTKESLSPNFTSIEFKGNVTALTGVADYILTAQDKKIWLETDYDDFIDAKMAGASWNDPEITRSLKDANVNVLEAKAFMDEAQLKTHLPQVIGQGIQIMHSDSARSAVPFYLTNSKIWIFGVVMKRRPEVEGATRSLYEAFIMPTFDMKPENISDPGPETLNRRSDRLQRFDNYELFLITMISWIRIDASKIMNAILHFAQSESESEEESNNETSEERTAD